MGQPPQSFRANPCKVNLLVHFLDNNPESTICHYTSKGQNFLLLQPGGELVKDRLNFTILMLSVSSDESFNFHVPSCTVPNSLMLQQLGTL